MKSEDLQEQAGRLVEESPSNRVFAGAIYLEKIFDYPLLKAAGASDPLFERLKEPGVIGEHHLSPAQWLTGARTVISYFLPFTQKIREANRIPRWPAPEWLYGRTEGEEFNNIMRQFLVDLAVQAGGRAAAPLLDSRYRIMDCSSNWSERHAAYIAGLGTFSLSKSLITEKGCAGRYGSIITDLAITPSVRPYTEKENYCSRCGDCIERCPPGAITEEGKDEEVCIRYMNNEIKPRYKPHYGCGKCQTAVACENTIPTS